MSGDWVQVTPVPPYAERVEQLLHEAHRLLRTYADDGCHADVDTERWLDNYALHTTQLDHPDLHPDTTRMWFGEKHGWLTLTEVLERPELLGEDHT